MPGAGPAGPQRERANRRRVRLVVALHLLAVGLIYTITLVFGGGLAGPMRPPDAARPAGSAAARPDTAVGPLPVTAASVTDPSAATGLPEWARRVEIAAPWEPR